LNYILIYDTLKSKKGDDKVLELEEIKQSLTELKNRIESLGESL